MSIFLVESCHVDQMTVHGGGGWGGSEAGKLSEGRDELWLLSGRVYLQLLIF